jgi:dynein heavy chain
MNPKAFENVLVSVFDKGISSVEGLPDLEPTVLDQIFWASKPMLETVHHQEPEVLKLQKKLKVAFQDSLPSLELYLRQYDKHLKLLNLDIAQYAASYEAENRTIDEMEQDILKHMRDWDALEKDIPSHITLGLFYVGCENIRSSMRKDLSKVVLEIIAKKTAKLSGAISQTFTNVQNRLKERPTKIEELMDLKEYMRTVPDTIKQQQLKIQEMLKNYDTLDRYRYECSNEDIRAKWQVFGGPQKVEELLKQTEVSADSDENTFRVRLAADQEVFKDRINTLNSLIQDFSKNSDITLIQDIVQDSSKIATDLKDCQQLAALFNSRERLFNLEPTVYEEVAQLTKDFEPYKSLWVTTADWLKWKDTWMLGSFVDLNAEEVEKGLNNAFRVVFKSLKQFRNEPGCLAVATQVRNKILS